MTSSIPLGAVSALIMSVVLSGGAANAQKAAQTNAPSDACAPRGLTRLVIRDISPGLAAADPRAQPRTLHRRGTTLLRSEEVPDLSRGGEARVVIISEPDIWAINLSSRSGTHSIDPGPELIVRAPVLPRTPDMPTRFQSLEFGCEASFITAHGKKQPQTGAWGMSQVEVYQVTEGAFSLLFLVDAQTRAPLILTYSRDGKVTFALRYDAFNEDVPGGRDLFVPPKGFKITEAASAPASVAPAAAKP